MPETLIGGSAPVVMDPITLLIGVGSVVFSWPVVAFFYAIYRLIKERIELQRYFDQVEPGIKLIRKGK